MKLNKMSNKARYIKCLLEDELDLRKRRMKKLLKL